MRQIDDFRSPLLIGVGALPRKHVFANIRSPAVWTKAMEGKVIWQSGSSGPDRVLPHLLSLANYQLRTPPGTARCEP